MTLRTIRLELARTKEFPEGSAGHGYEFIAPLDKSGQLDSDEWQRFRQACTVRRFWRGENDEHGQLERTLDGTWVFSYEVGEDYGGRSLGVFLVKPGETTLVRVPDPD